MNIHIVVASLDFPIWILITHYINLLFIGLLIRSGIQILAAHPRLYWKEGSNPARQWLKFTTTKVPKNKLYTSIDDENSVTPLIALPGGDNLGLGRLWHGGVGAFDPNILVNLSDAWHTLLTYLSFHIPPSHDFRPYDPLQQLAYASVVFLLAPFMLLTGQPW